MDKELELHEQHLHEQSKHECIRCWESKAEKTLKFGCGHRMCNNCLIYRFESTIAEAGRHAIFCCSFLMPVRIDKIRKHVPPSLVNKYVSLRLEATTKDAVYCSKRTCSTFVKPSSIHNGVAFCQVCNTQTCAICRLEFHWGPCMVDRDDEANAIAQEHQYKRCPDCRMLCELMSGCRNVTCVCGCAFCYDCGYANCSCFEDEEDMARDAAFEESRLTHDRVLFHLQHQHEVYGVVEDLDGTRECHACNGYIVISGHGCTDCEVVLCDACKSAWTHSTRMEAW